VAKKKKLEVGLGKPNYIQLSCGQVDMIINGWYKKRLSHPQKVGFWLGLPHDHP
jgi:hypothetical protein